MPEPLPLIPDSEREAAERAARVLREGGIALLPAEGVYGLHALASRPEAVDRLRKLKDRGPGRGFIGLLARPDDLATYAQAPPRALALARAHWPGALTLVVPARAGEWSVWHAPDGTIALRCPGSAFLRAVVAAAGGLVLSTSANEPGAPPATRAEGVAPATYDIGIDGGTLSGIPSTIVRVAGGRTEVLRAGAVTLPERLLDDGAPPS